MFNAERLRTIAHRLQRRAQPELEDHWQPLLINNLRIGLVAPGIAEFLQAQCGARTTTDGVAIEQTDAGELKAEVSAIADRLRDAGLLSGWRNEVLDVRAADDQSLATIERAACRPLGITTVAVHLNAYRDDRTLLVARRARHKSIDPGMLDNLVGGMVPAGETILQALQREAWEEAGLQLPLDRLQQGRRFHVRRPVAEGLQSELIHVFDLTIEDPTALANQDGEVAMIDAHSIGDVVDAIEADEFTLEAALATIESLLRHQRIAGPTGLFF